MARKPTGQLDKLDPSAQEAIFAHCETGCTLEAGAKWLASEWGIEMDKSTLGNWLTKTRREKDFTQRLIDLAAGNEKAGLIAGSVGGALKLTEANVMLFGQALLDAQIAKKPDEIELAAEGLTKLLKALLKAQDQQHRRDSLDLDRQKYDDAKKSKVDAGLDALFEQIKSNAAAVTAFKNLKAALAS